MFNDNPALSDSTLIVNDADYDRIASQCSDVWKGILKLYTFDNWKNSGKGIAAVQKFLQKKNQIPQAEEKYYAASSKIERYTTEKQAAEFFIFLMVFIILLFCASADIMIHFKIKAESEEERRMLSGLYRVGITDTEMLELIRYKNKAAFLPPVILGILTGTIAGYTINQSYGYGWIAVGFSLLIGILLAAVHYSGIRNYSRRELLSLHL